jgi:serine phosphatase RsbU (regulator of sigma subunit)
VRGIQLGAEDYLPKPFEPALLQARISSSLEKKRLRDLEQVYLKGLERELEIGREIQRGFLPSELPKVDRWEIAAYFKAAREVAGDFYDAFVLPDGNLVCVVGDVCGKGVGAALFMTLFRSLIRATIMTSVFAGVKDVETLAPAERLHHVISFANSYVAETHGDAGMFAAVFLGVINLQNGTLTYINGGNEPPLVLGKGGTVTALTGTGPVVGILPDAEFSVKEVSLGASDVLLAFTDGIPDALSTDDVSFGNERLLQLLNGGDTTAQGLLGRIEQELRHFIGMADQFDDITLLAIKRGQ